MTNYYDSILLNQLKEEFCHLNLDRCGAVQKTVTVMKPTKRQIQYTIQVLRINKIQDIKLIYFNNNLWNI